MVEMRRKDRQATEDLAWELLENCEYATLATVNADGSPYCVPISPIVYDGALWFHGALAGTKVENFKRNANVCVSCVGQTKLRPEYFTTEFESAVVHGVIAAIEDPAEKRTIMYKICEKYAPTNLDKFANAMDKSEKRTGIYKISVKEITAKCKHLK